MKLILRDYLLSLKEDGELDAFVVNLIRELDMIPLTTPQRGRQYGVDIAAVGPDFENTTQQKETLFLFVVKQGNITRTNWDAPETGVRNSLNEILDVYLSTHKPQKYEAHPVKIVLVTNGEIKSNVYTNWVNYTNKNSNGGLSFDFWGTDKLADLSEKVQFPESLFSDAVYALLRKTLVLLDLEEYDYEHFYKLIEQVLSKQIKGKNENLKKIRLLSTCFTIVVNWSITTGNIKPSVIIGERLLLLVWQWITQQSETEKGELLSEYIALIHQKMGIDQHYLEKIKESFLIKNGLAFAGPMDHTYYALVCYEQIGLVASMGLTRLWIADLLSHFPNTISASAFHFRGAEEISLYLANLIANNPGCLYPKFDEHCIEVNLALSLLHQTDRHEDGITWLAKLIHYLYYNIQMRGFIPLFITDYEKLAESESKTNKDEPRSSILITTLAEWCVIFKSPELYEQLSQIIKENMPNINLQLWFPDILAEQSFYEKNAMSDSGNTKVGIQLPDSFLDYEMEMAEERALFFHQQQLSFEKENFYFLGPLAFRHHRTYVFPNNWRQFLQTNFCFNIPEEIEEKDKQQ